MPSAHAPGLSSPDKRRLPPNPRTHGPLFRSTALIDTENAFKVGPYIARLEAGGAPSDQDQFRRAGLSPAEHIAAEVKRQIDNDLTHYVDPQGILPLREAVAGYMGPPRGLDIDPERVVVFPGAKPPIGLCQQTYCNPGDEVIYPSPGFPIYESFIGYVGAKPVPLHLEEGKGFAFSGEELGGLITERTKLIFLCFPSNPTGGVASREELEGIAEVIREKAPANCRVYSDEVYENILFDGSEHVSISRVPGYGRTDRFGFRGLKVVFLDGRPNRLGCVPDRWRKPRSSRT